jgi:hypothetical protein
MHANRLAGSSVPLGGARGTQDAQCSSPLECARLRCHDGEDMGRAILLWLLGVPIPIIILIALFWY